MKSTHIILRSAPRPVGGATRGEELTGTAPAAGVSAHALDVERHEVPVLAQQDDVLAVAPSMPMRLVQPLDQPMPVLAAESIAWGVTAVGADTSPLDGEGIVVAVLDTGIDASHPAFAGVQLVQKDFTGEGDGDRNGHGTHVAGTIFGRNVNGIRIGVAPGIKRALVGKVLNGNGSGTSEGIVAAILWAVEEGAHVISMSLGMDFTGYVRDMVEMNGMPIALATSRALEGYRNNTRLFDTLADHIKSRGAESHPTIIIAAAGNESHREISPDFEVTVSPPAVAEGIVSVAALGSSPSGYTVPNFSNTGAMVSAPGVNIVSAAMGGGLRALNGTSMAAPHVAGVAALWAQQLAEHRALTAFNLMGKLAGSASSEGVAAGVDPFDVGAGMVRCPQTR